MICEAKLHSTRVIGPAIAVKLMRVDNTCRGEAKVTALCQTCYEANLIKIRGQYYNCHVCGVPHPFREVWRMIGDV